MIYVMRKSSVLSPKSNYRILLLLWLTFKSESLGYHRKKLLLKKVVKWLKVPQRWGTLSHAWGTLSQYIINASISFLITAFVISHFQFYSEMSSHKNYTLRCLFKKYRYYSGLHVQSWPIRSDRPLERSKLSYSCG